MSTNQNPGLALASEHDIRIVQVLVAVDQVYVLEFDLEVLAAAPEALAAPAGFQTDFTGAELAHHEAAANLEAREELGVGNAVRCARRR